MAERLAGDGLRPFDGYGRVSVMMKSCSEVEYDQFPARWIAGLDFLWRGMSLKELFMVMEILAVESWTRCSVEMEQIRGLL